jgi:filamentous hemagglutinin
MAASGVKETAGALGDGKEAEAIRAVLHTVVGCAGAAAGNASCGAGALGAGAGSVINSLLAELPAGATNEEKRRGAIWWFLWSLASLLPRA